MSRQRRPGAVFGSPEHRARVSAGLQRYHALRRDRERLTAADVLNLTKNGAVTRPEMRPFLEAAADESEALLAAFGGADRVSAQRRALLDDFVRVGIVLRATLARYAQTGDAECGARVGTLAAVRRASLVAIGLDEHREEIDLRAYVAKRRADAEVETAQGRAGAPIDAPPVEGVASDDERASGATDDTLVDGSGVPSRDA